MNSLKSMLMLVVLGGISYGVWLALTAEPPAPPPEGAPEDWAAAPLVEMPGEPMTATTLSAVPNDLGGMAPPYGGAVGGDAPAFDPASMVHGAPYPPAPRVGTSEEVVPGGSTPPLPPIRTDAAPAEGQWDNAPAAEVPAAPTERYGSNESPSGGIAPPAVETPPPSSNSEASRTNSFPAEDRYGSGRYGNRSASAATETGAVEDRYGNSPADESAPPFNAGGSAGPGVSPPAVNLMPPQSSVDRGTSPPLADGSSSDMASDDFVESMNAIYDELEQGRLAEAHAALSSWYGDSSLTDEQYQQLMDLLDRVAGTVVYSQSHVLLPAHVVRPGETLEQIATQYQVPWQLLAKINGIRNPNELVSGSELKVLQGPFDAVVDVQALLLTLYVDGYYAGRFQLGLGAETPVNDGEYTVLRKVDSAGYRGPDGMIPATDPANPFGGRLIDLGSNVSIHGSPDPSGIGQTEGPGCIRLSPTDISDVYDILSVGSRVIIRR